MSGRLWTRGGNIEDQLRDDKVAEQHQQGQQHQGGKGGGQGSGRPGLDVVVEKELLGKAGKGVEQVGHHAAQQDGAQGADDPAHAFGQVRQVEQSLDHQKDYHKGQQDQTAEKQQLFQGNFQKGTPPFPGLRLGKKGPGRRENLGEKHIHYLV